MKFSMISDLLLLSNISCQSKSGLPGRYEPFCREGASYGTLPTRSGGREKIQPFYRDCKAKQIHPTAVAVAAPEQEAIKIKTNELQHPKVGRIERYRKYRLSKAATRPVSGRKLKEKVYLR